MKPSQYEIQAQAVADAIGIEVITAFQGGQCPPWTGVFKHNKHTSNRMACLDCGTVHGNKFRVTIRRKSGKGAALHFDFWASWADCYATVGAVHKWSASERIAKGLEGWRYINEPDSMRLSLKHKPSMYDILACVASDMSMPTEADDVAEEFGDMKPSQAEAIAKHARKLQAFFTEAERSQLAEVQ